MEEYDQVVPASDSGDVQGLGESAESDFGTGEEEIQGAQLINIVKSLLGETQVKLCK